MGCKSYPAGINLSSRNILWDPTHGAPRCSSYAFIYLYIKSKWKWEEKRQRGRERGRTVFGFVKKNCAGNLVTYEIP